MFCLVLCLLIYCSLVFKKVVFIDPTLTGSIHNGLIIYSVRSHALVLVLQM